MEVCADTFDPAAKRHKEDMSEASAELLDAEAVMRRLEGEVQAVATQLSATGASASVDNALRAEGARSAELTGFLMQRLERESDVVEAERKAIAYERNAFTPQHTRSTRRPGLKGKVVTGGMLEVSKRVPRRLRVKECYAQRVEMGPDTYHFFEEAEKRFEPSKRSPRDMTGLTAGEAESYESLRTFAVDKERAVLETTPSGMVPYSGLGAWEDPSKPPYLVDATAAQFTSDRTLLVGRIRRRKDEGPNSGSVGTRVQQESSGSMGAVKAGSNDNRRHRPDGAQCARPAAHVVVAPDVPPSTEEGERFGTLTDDPPPITSRGYRTLQRHTGVLEPGHRKGLSLAVLQVNKGVRLQQSEVRLSIPMPLFWSGLTGTMKDIYRVDAQIMRWKEKEVELVLSWDPPDV